MWKYSNDTEITVWFHFESMHSAGIFQFSEKIKSFYKEVSFLLKLIFLKFTNYFKLAYGFSFLHRASCVLYYRQKICGKIKIKIHWRPTPVLLPGESHGQRSLVDCSPWVARIWDTTEQLHFHFSLSCIGQPTPVFLPGESQGQGSLVGCHLWGHTESDTTDVT